MGELFEHIPPEYALAIPPASAAYHPDLTSAFQARFGDRLLRTEFATFSNDMPLHLVGEAGKILLVSTFNGDNWREASVEIAYFGNALTDNPDEAGPNTRELGIFFPFADLRQDARTRKPIKDSVGRAIVKAQGVTDRALAKIIRHVAGAHFVCFVDMHKPWKSAKAFTEQDLDVINLSTNKILTEYLVANELLSSNLETTVVSTDMGIYLTAYDLSGKIGKAMNADKEPVPMVIFKKTRVGTDVIPEHIYGDLKGKRAIVIDDIIGSGTTLEETIEAILKYDPAELLIFIPHPVYAPKGYYEKLENILKIDKVKLLMVADTLPLVRQGISYPHPYLKFDGGKKVEVLKIHDWIAEKAHTILTARNIEEAIKILAEEIVELEDPYQLITEMTAITVTPEPNVAVYYEGQKYVPIPMYREIFRSP